MMKLKEAQKRLFDFVVQMIVKRDSNKFTATSLAAILLKTTYEHAIVFNVARI